MQVRSGGGRLAEVPSESRTGDGARKPVSNGFGTEPPAQGSSMISSRPDTCRSLRTAFAWRSRAIGRRPTGQFRLTDGQLSPVTAPQLDRLAPIRE